MKFSMKGKSSCAPHAVRYTCAPTRQRWHTESRSATSNTASKNLLETSKALVNPITALMVPVIFFLREDMTQKFAENQSNQSLHANILGAVLASENP